VTDGSRTR